jgi:class 3 adenylate cyclase/pimeloyl-ACP methyl ester carboxylesterase
MDPPETYYAKRGDLQVAYQVFGNGPPDVLLIPNWFTNVEVSWEVPPFARFFRALAGFARVVVLDPRGMGASDPAPDGALPTLEDWVEDARTVLDEVGIGRAAVIGLAPGAPIAILFAATHPERTASLVIVNGSHRAAGMTPEFKEQIIQQQDAWGSIDAVKMLAPSATESERQALVRQQRKIASPATASKMMRMRLETDVGQVLPSIRVPTLVIHRTEMALAPRAHGQFLAEHIPDAKLIELPGNDWFPHFGDTDAILREIRGFVTGRRAATGGDRVLATVLFTDIVQSTERAAALGDDRWKALLAEHRASVRRELDEFRGREIDTTGDGFLATFDGPGRAIHCARAIRDSVRSLGLEIRAGLHTGEIEMTGNDVAGIAVHIGARVAALAAPSEVLVSSTVKDLVVGSGIEFEDRGARALKGVPGEWRIFAVAD